MGPCCTWRCRTPDVVRLLLAALPPGAVAAQDNAGNTALHAAAARGHAEAAGLLLAAAPASLQTRNCDGATPLQVAAYAGHNSIVRMLLEHIIGLADSTQLSDAVRSCQKAAWEAAQLRSAAVAAGDVAWVLFMLEADPAAVGRERQHGMLLGAALRAGHLAVAEAILAAAPEAAAAHNPITRQTAMHWAAAEGNEAAVRCLMEARPEAVCEWADGGLPVHLAAAAGAAACLRLLLAPPNQQTASLEDQRGWLPLHHAAEHGHVEAAQLLLAAHPAAVRATTADEQGWTPLLLAIQDRKSVV